MDYLAEFRQGNGPMAMNAIDFYRNEKGEIVQRDWAMGGQSEKIVNSVPDSIKDYRKI